MDTTKVKRRIIPGFGYLALLVVAGGIGTLLYWKLSTPTEVLSIRPQPIPVLTKVVKLNPACAIIGADRCVVLKITQCKNVEANGKISPTFVSNTDRIPTPEIIERGERKCQNDITVPFPVPRVAPPGKYHIHFRTTYKVNPITTIVQDFDSEEFEVQ